MMLRLVAAGKWSTTSPNLQQIPKDCEEPAPWDAMSRELVSLSDIAQDELLGDPYSALADDGIDAYTGADTVLDGSHDHALMMAGWAMMEVDDES
jgi:hypothetical protein